MTQEDMYYMISLCKIQYQVEYFFNLFFLKIGYWLCECVYSDTEFYTVGLYSAYLLVLSSIFLRHTCDVSCGCSLLICMTMYSSRLWIYHTSLYPSFDVLAVGSAMKTAAVNILLMSSDAHMYSFLLDLYLEGELLHHGTDVFYFS